MSNIEKHSHLGFAPRCQNGEWLVLTEEVAEFKSFSKIKGLSHGNSKTREVVMNSLAQSPLKRNMYGIARDATF
jgi:hypothetical protein